MEDGMVIWCAVMMAMAWLVCLLNPFAAMKHDKKVKEGPIITTIITIISQNQPSNDDNDEKEREKRERKRKRVACNVKNDTRSKVLQK
uniref:Putative secreted protein n=1 Tax=Anopheles darlingi TaxID=43151 RepID=A0A2M4DH71_ANODA